MNYLELRKGNIRFFSGLGLDIGPFDKPFVPDAGSYGLEVETVDRWCAEDLKKFFPEIKDSVVPDPTYIHDVSANGLGFTEGKKYDFVICSHVIEHVANPFWLIHECRRVLKDGGVLYISAPDGRYSQDKGRHLTSFSYLWNLYKHNIREIPDERVEEYLRSPCISSHGWVKEVLKQNALTKDILENEKLRSFHVHVWNSFTFIDHFVRFSEKAGLGWRLLDLFLWENNHYEAVLIVRKTTDSQESHFRQSVKYLLNIRSGGNMEPVKDDTAPAGSRPQASGRRNTGAAVGIVMRTKNRPILLERAVSSVLSQTFQDWRLVIVNDGGLREPVEDIYKINRDNFRDRCDILHRTDSTGMESASNAGINQLESRYLVIHDDDDSWQPAFLEKCVAYLENRPHHNTRGVVSYVDRVIEIIDGKKVVEISRDPFNTWYSHIRLYRMLANNMFPPISFLFEKAVIDEIGGFREDLPVLGDWEFHIRFLVHYDIGMVLENLANYHHRVDSSDAVEYENSVMAGDARHAYYQNLLRNEWLREDIKKGKLGIGFMTNFCGSELKLHEYVFNNVALKKEYYLRKLFKRK